MPTQMCPRCKGEKTHRCGYCGNSPQSRISCDNCKGKGVVKCTACGGSGTVNVGSRL